jgi:hypothetical protein
MKHTTPTAKIIVVTKELADYYLSNNETNRSINSNRVMKYANQMKAGKWQLNGEAIIIGTNEALLDGQHRLKAISQYNLTINLMFCFGIDPATFDTIDTGDSRTNADVLAISGIRPGTAKTLSVCIKKDILMQNTGRISDTAKMAYKITPHEILKASESNHDYIKAVEFIETFPRKNLQIAASALSFLAYRFFKIDYRFSHEWMTGFITGVGLAADDPRIWIRNLLWRYSNSSVDRTLLHKIGIIIRVWHSEITGKRFKYYNNYSRDPLAAFEFIKLPTDKN